MTLSFVVTFHILPQKHNPQRWGGAGVRGLRALGIQGREESELEWKAKATQKEDDMGLCKLGKVGC